MHTIIAPYIFALMMPPLFMRAAIDAKLSARAEAPDSDRYWYA
jgi:hypothetical protein